ncbi:MAG: hypothetical protein JRI23_35650 [Deltaproteobacteria bacterium]|nr:hypothetical protein [Deltaproteobacteria bacterium]MBW2537666.1 hypothetical protein [Deltaproteobacteria bacterium]
MRKFRTGGWVCGLALLALAACSSDSSDDDDDGSGGTIVTMTGSGSGGTGSGTAGSGGTTGTGTGAGDPGDCAGGPLSAPIPNCRPTPAPSTGDFHQDCVDRINQFRWECQCLPPLQRWTDAEACTDQQSADDQTSGGAHGNFGACGESAQNTCPDWPSEEQVISGCLQMMWDEGPGEPFSQHGHYINMSSQTYSKVACGSSSSSSGVWSNQNFAQ